MSSIQPGTTLWDELSRCGPGRVLIFIHPGFDAAARLVEDLRTQFPGLRISVVTHLSLTPSQVAALDVEEVFTFDKRARHSLWALARMGLQMWSQIRRNRYDLFLVWYRGFTFSPDQYLFRSFAALSGARRLLFWDDEANRTWHQGRILWALYETPKAVLTYLLVAVLVVLVWAWVRLGSLIPRTRQKLVTPANVIGFLRTDLELAMGRVEVGGSVSHVKGMVEGFVATGQRVVALGTGELAGLPDQVPTLVVRPWLVPNVPREVTEMLASFPVYWRGRRYLRQQQVDVLYHRYSMNNFGAVLLATSLGVPLVCEANNSEVEMRRQFTRVTFPFLARAIERWNVAAADMVCTVSERNVQVFRELGLPTQHFHVIPNGVNTERFHPGVGDAGLREKLGLVDAFVVGFVGLFYPWHGIRYLAEALVAAAERMPRLVLLLVGDGDERNCVQQLLEPLRLMHRVVFTGMVPHEQVPHYLAAMDVVASPHAPWKEFFGSPIKIFEYMAAGKAIVAAGVGQIPQVVEHGCSGLIHTPGDVDALCACLQTLYDDPALRQALGKNARDVALQRHTWAANAGRVLAALSAQASGAVEVRPHAT